MKKLQIKLASILILLILSTILFSCKGKSEGGGVNDGSSNSTTSTTSTTNATDTSPAIGNNSSTTVNPITPNNNSEDQKKTYEYTTEQVLKQNANGTLLNFF